MTAPLLSFVVGARPNFVKAAPLVKAAAATGDLRLQIIHTGQHYDAALSDLFFRDLELPAADLMLDVGSGTHAVQTAQVMERIEPILAEHRPQVVVVFGDVNSTVAATLTAAKLGLTVAHVEAGLRSFDRTMPEEINRIVTDAIADLLFVTEASGVEHLEREGASPDRVHLVGNTMIDSLIDSLQEAKRLQPAVLERHGLEVGEYAVLTLHRPSNVDEEENLLALLEVLARISTTLPILFPVHPRTRRHLGSAAEVLTSESGFVLTEPLGYLEFLAALDGARLVLTDSGGIQEETTALRVPCLTLRDNTERPITVELGTNVLAGTDPRRILHLVERELARPLDRETGRMPPLWDGRAAERIVEVLRREIASNR